MKYDNLSSFAQNILDVIMPNSPLLCLLLCNLSAFLCLFGCLLDKIELHVDLHEGFFGSFSSDLELL